MTRQNQHGEPCPPWCAEDHDSPDGTNLHVTSRQIVNLGGHQGSIRTRAGQFGADPEVVVHATWYDPASGRPADADLYVPLKDAGHLAGLVEILSHATPDQHHELAAAIRGAAAAIEDGAR